VADGVEEGEKQLSAPIFQASPVTEVSDGGTFLGKRVGAAGRCPEKKGIIIQSGRTSTVRNPGFGGEKSMDAPQPIPPPAKKKKNKQKQKKNQNPKKKKNKPKQNKTKQNKTKWVGGWFVVC